MATHIVTLKDNNDDISYPITPVDAVFVDSNTTLADALDDKADADMSNITNASITGTKIASNTITSSNIDFTTFDKITVRKTNDSSTMGTGTITMDAVVDSIGSRLTLSSGGVKVGAGITKVLVSSNVFFNATNGKNYGWYDLRINGSNTGYEAIASIYGGTYGTASFSPIVLSVSENDIITLYNKESGVNIRGGWATYLTVQVIK